MGNDIQEVKRSLVENSIEITSTSNFDIARSKLVEIMHQYQNRQYGEELSYLSANNGISNYKYIVSIWYLLISKTYL